MTIFSMRFKDLEKLNLRLKFVICRLKLISATVPAAVENNARFKSGQN